MYVLPYYNNGICHPVLENFSEEERPRLQFIEDETFFSPEKIIRVDRGRVYIDTRNVEDSDIDKILLEISNEVNKI